MIGCVTLGTNDLARAARFYDVLLAELGATRYFETDRGISWNVTPDRTSLALHRGN